MDGLFYLASPYSHTDPAIQEKRFVDACRYAGQIMNCGVHVFSTIAHTHPIACVCSLPKEWEYWRVYDSIILRFCTGMIILCIDGWEKSVGISEEIRLAEQFRLPVYKLFPGHSVVMQVEGIKAVERARLAIQEKTHV
jgi:hypothetical protein